MRLAILNGGIVVCAGATLAQTHFVLKLSLGSGFVAADDLLLRSS